VRVSHDRMATEYVIDGAEVATLEDFFQRISDVVIPGAAWGRNLDAFNDILRGGFGTPEEGFTLRWANSQISREKLGYPETVRQLELRLKRCHPSNRERVRHELAEAQKGKGPTVFDWLLEIIRYHGVGGGEAEDNVRLVVE
jgi:RNAse (barnase) inhibitor barstar